MNTWKECGEKKIMKGIKIEVEGIKLRGRFVKGWMHEVKEVWDCI